MRLGKLYWELFIGNKGSNPAKKVRKIENYLDKKELQNEKGLDKYIDMILKFKRVF